MAMTALYPNYDMSSLSSSSSSQTMSHHHHHPLHNHHHPHHHSHHQQHQQQQQQHHHHQQQQQHHHHAPVMQQTNRSASLLAAAAHQQQQQQSQQSPQTQQQQQQQSHQQQQQQQPQKDYSIPLHVDCSVEYELPNQAKPPVGGRVEPLLMIHPCYFRKMESQRRSPFINNMPNNSSSASTARGSSSAAAVAAAASSRRSNLIGAAPSQPAAHLLSQNAPNVIQQQQLQQQSQQHQKLQQQLDEYVQRQMAHISQQAQFPSIAQQQQQQQQSASQYGAATGSGNWDRYLSAMPNASSMLQGKVNIPNQSAYKKSGKRHLAATCANNAYAASHLEGALPNGIARWDEKTAMATIPRDYAPEHAKCSSAVASTAGRALYCGQQQQQPQIQGGAQLMSGAKRDRDPMLSGGCIYSNNNNNNNSNNSNNNNNNNNNNSSSGNSSGNSNNNNNNGDMNGLVSTAVGLPWPIQKSPMAAIPNSNYHQAGPDSIPNNSSSNHHSSSNSTNSSNATTTTTTAASKSRQSSGQTVIHHSHYAAQQPHQLSDKVINSNNNNNSSVITVKCRQYRNSHRMHPYMMNMSAPAVNNGVSLAGAGLTYFPQLNANPFAQIQQVSCYNV